jgi:hypothetical protein
MKKISVTQTVVSAGAIVAFSILSGCATPQNLQPKILAVEQSIQSAKAVNAENYSPEALKSAEAKLTEAQSAVAAQNVGTAARLLDEAMSDAEFASINAPTEKTKKEVADLRDAIKKLRSEIKKLSANE